MSIHRPGGHIHELLCRSARNLVKHTREPLAASTTLLLHQCQKQQPIPLNMLTMHDQLIVAVARIYKAHCQKQKIAVGTISTRPGTATYRALQKIVHICLENNWLIGEFIAAQFALLRVPLMRHISSSNATMRYQKFCRMLANQRITDSVAPSEKVAIERATKATVTNLITILQTRPRGQLAVDDFSFCDRYTLAHFQKEQTITEIELPQDAIAEIDAANKKNGRWELICQSCQAAATEGLSELATGSTAHLDTMRTLATLYKVTHPALERSIPRLCAK